MILGIGLLITSLFTMFMGILALIDNHHISSILCVFVSIFAFLIGQDIIRAWIKLRKAEANKFVEEHFGDD